MKTQNKSALSELLDNITPEEQEKTDIKMMLAAKIADAMQAKGWNKTALLQAMGKSNPSEITRWLSGTHNFTIDTLIDLQRVLDIRLLDVTSEVSPVQSFVFTIKTDTDWASYLPYRESAKKPSGRIFELNYI